MMVRLLTRSRDFLSGVATRLHMIRLRLEERAHRLGREPEGDF